MGGTMTVSGPITPLPTARRQRGQAAAEAWHAPRPPSLILQTVQPRSVRWRTKAYENFWRCSVNQPRPAGSGATQSLIKIQRTGRRRSFAAACSTRCRVSSQNPPTPFWVSVGTPAHTPSDFRRQLRLENCQPRQTNAHEAGGGAVGKLNSPDRFDVRKYGRRKGFEDRSERCLRHAAMQTSPGTGGKNG